MPEAPDILRLVATPHPYGSGSESEERARRKYGTPCWSVVAPEAGSSANLDHHVDVIKVFATDRAGVPTSDPRKRLLTADELTAAVEEARKAGCPSLLTRTVTKGRLLQCVLA